MAKTLVFTVILQFARVLSLYLQCFAVVQLHSEQLSQTTQQKNTQCEKTDNGEENG